MGELISTLDDLASSYFAFRTTSLVVVVGVIAAFVVIGQITRVMPNDKATVPQMESL